MWDLVSVMLAFAAIMLIMNYVVEPKKIFEDISKLKSGEHRIQALEEEVKELKALVKSLQQTSTKQENNES